MTTQLVIVSLIGFAGMFVRGLTGFGSALVMTPLMLFFSCRKLREIQQGANFFY